MEVLPLILSDIHPLPQTPFFRLMFFVRTYGCTWIFFLDSVLGRRKNLGSLAWLSLWYTTRGPFSAPFKTSRMSQSCPIRRAAWLTFTYTECRVVTDIRIFLEFPGTERTERNGP